MDEISELKTRVDELERRLNSHIDKRTHQQLVFEQYNAEAKNDTRRRGGSR